MMKIEEIRKEFPILNQTINNRPLVYLDNAASYQKPQQVIDTMSNYYQTLNANVHRGVHSLSQRATDKFELSRQKVKEFIGASSTEEIIFTRGTTESINLVAHSFCQEFLEKDDEIIISEMEHHSNIVPWQMAAEKKGAKLRVIPFFDSGELDLNTFASLINPKTKIIALTYVSNALGVVNPIKECIKIAHKHNIPILIDAAQAISHRKIDVQELGCDLLCFSGHKMYAPMGVGVLYGKKELLDKMPPYQFGGEMIQTVSFEKTTFNTLPFKFEAGTPSVADVLGLHSAIDFIERIGIDNIYNHEKELLDYAQKRLEEIDDIIIYAKDREKSGAISFNIKNVHPFDIGTLLDQLAIAIRTGHHCTHPVMQHYKISGTARVSFAAYNTKQEVDYFIESLKKVVLMLS